MLEARLKDLRHIPVSALINKWTECDRSDFAGLTNLEVFLQLRARRRLVNKASQSTALFAMHSAIREGAKPESVSAQDYMPYPEVGAEEIYLDQGTVQQIALISVRSNGFAAWLDKKASCFVSEVK